MEVMEMNGNSWTPPDFETLFGWPKKKEKEEKPLHDREKLIITVQQLKVKVRELDDICRELEKLIE